VDRGRIRLLQSDAMSHDSLRCRRTGHQAVPAPYKMAARALTLATLFIVMFALTLPASAASAGAVSPATASSGLTVRLPATITTRHGGEFLSPSRNISCELDWDLKGLPATAYCQTMAPPRSVTMSPNGAVKKCSGVVCLGNPAQNARVLPYMASTATGPFLCASRLDGFACSAAGRAFLISKSGITTYAVLPHTTMALYTAPAGHPTLSMAKGFGWLVALGRSGQVAEMLVECGNGANGKLPANRLWTVDLSAVKFFEVETNPANVVAGSVVNVARSNWAGDVRVNGWDGYFDLGVKNSFLSNGPGSSAC
jgi:hypothetical protein